jgi:hypothetical protein
MGGMAVAMANKVIVAGAGHGMAAMGVVGDEDLASAQFEPGILTVVAEQAAGFCGQVCMAIVSPTLFPCTTWRDRPSLMDARRVLAPMRSPQWIAACAPAACASVMAATSASERSWLSETMQIFIFAWAGCTARALATSGITPDPSHAKDPTQIAVLRGIGPLSSIASLGGEIIAQMGYVLM